MGRGKFKGKPTGQRQFSTPEEMLAGTSSRPRTFKREEAKPENEDINSKEESGEQSEEESEDELDQKRKGTQGIIQIDNPNLEKSKNLKARDVDAGKTTELSRRERLVNAHCFIFMSVACCLHDQEIFFFFFKMERMDSTLIVSGS
uniref:Uncharacterized protein n=1 Tax=Rhizophora mucronata TaxID=61149 RepID=A0A2P2KPR0_RHIMU